MLDCLEAQAPTGSAFAFLDLPLEILHKIHDSLQAADRVKLNMALPRTHKIHRTVMTDTDTTRKLGLVSYMLKKRRPEKVPAAVAKYIMDNIKDPTAVELCKEFKVVEEKSVNYLINDIKEGDLCNVGKYPSPSEVAESLQLHEVVSALAQHATPELFIALKAVVQEAIINNAFQLMGFFFDVVNFVNEDLLKHIVENKEEYGSEEITSGCDYITGNNILGIFKHNHYIIEMLNDVVGIKDEDKKELLATCIEEMDFAGADFMMRMGVAL